MWLLLRLFQPLAHKFFKVKRVWDFISLRYFNRSCAAITGSTPLQAGSIDFAITSQLQHKDVIPYLVALKSFCHFCVTPKEVHIVNDGTLTENDIALLKRQIPMLKLIDITDVDTGSCPRGGTWERLAYISQLSQRIYTLQMDADTLTRAPLSEVIDCIQEGRSFILGTDTGNIVEGFHTGERLGSFQEAADFANQVSHSHIQLRTERAMPKLDMKQQYYMRGCSGFAGFAKGVIDWSVAEEFSAQMRKLLDDGEESWKIWGTEQITSNFLLSNTPNPFVLVEPKYLNSLRHKVTEDVNFLHFLGTYRFSDDVYRRQAIDVTCQIQGRSNAIAG